ncbi:MAG TPA: ribosome-associated translation inhibitor RaiA [Thermodesulfobacteriota bacterium]|nr:ribosome-associated translation inhibitor RaiA [Thermodesulfobacteriota bacterium]
MKINYIGQGMEVSQDLKDFVERKLSTFERHLKETDEGEVVVSVTFTLEEHRQRRYVDIDVYLDTPGGGALHVREESNNFRRSLESALDDIDRQLKKLMDRRRERRREAAREKEKNTETVSVSTDDLIEEEKLPIAKPLTVEEALMILQDEDRFFLAFRNAETGEINVIYRKKSGVYGHITP